MAQAVFYEDAVNSLDSGRVYPKQQKRCELDIVSRPEINVEQIEKGKAFIFTADCSSKTGSYPWRVQRSRSCKS